MLQRFIAQLDANRGTAIAAVLGAAAAVAIGAVVGLDPVFVVPLLVAIGLTTWGIYRWRFRHLGPRPKHVPGTTVASSGLAALVVVFLVAQAVPYGRDHSNPPITGEPAWATAQTRDLMVRSCFDCHSNEVRWPWFTNVAPFSWATQKHVDDGRDKVNYQEFDRPQDEAEETFETVEEGSMPPPYYTLIGLHSDADLSSAEFSALLDGLRNTPGMTE
ncbi:MAG: heme-binding domain-containing protein [Acidimicrobiia bacterium]|nr:heme-binding domain-containing protein [Acidimicrobiia bacterium]